MSYNPGTGSIEFEAKLSTSVDTEGNPNHDLFKFKGKLNQNEITGILEKFDAKRPKNPLEREEVTLKKDEKDKDMVKYYSTPKTFAEWEIFTEEIMEFRGPKWQ